MNKHHYAVVVGINRYPALSDLTGARGDAEAFARWLERPDGGALPPSNIRRVMATEEEEASFRDSARATPVREQIEDAIAASAEATKLAFRVDPSVWDEGRFYLYVAGHGLAPGGGEGALYLANAREGAGRHLELGEYRKWCTRCAFFREVVVFADCCRTRQSTVRALAPTLDECRSPLVDRQSTWVIGYGSGLGDPTYENDARGYFTAALLEGFDNAKADETGAVTAATLGPYVKTAVANATKGLSHPQTAELFADAGARVVFGEASGARGVQRVTIAFPRGYSGSVELRFNALELVGAHDAATGPWSLPLKKGLYEIAPCAGEPQRAFADHGLFRVIGGDENVQL